MDVGRRRVRGGDCSVGGGRSVVVVVVVEVVVEVVVGVGVVVVERVVLCSRRRRTEVGSRSSEPLEDDSNAYGGKQGDAEGEGGKSPAGGGGWCVKVTT